MPEQVERRALGEVRAKAESPVIEGYAIRFGVLSGDLGGFREFISPDVKIETEDVRALFNHDGNFVLGRQSAKTLDLRQDKDGLWMETHPPDTRWAQDLLISIRRGDINQQSFAFRVLPDGDDWRDTADGWVRTLRGIRIYDVSVVTNPAYPQTDASVRSASEIFASRRGAPPATPDWAAIHKLELDFLALSARTAGSR